MPTQHPTNAAARNDDAYTAAEGVKTAVNRLFTRVPNIANPAVVGPLLGVLINAQRELAAIYDQLHTWHAATIDGTHFAGYNAHGTEISQYRAAIYCRTAAANGEAATTALNRAWTINQTLHWFDTGVAAPAIRPDIVDDAIYEHLCALRATERAATAHASQTITKETARQITFMHNMIAHTLGVKAPDIISTAHEVLYLPSRHSAPVVLWRNPPRDPMS